MKISNGEFKELVLDQDKLVRLFGYLAEKAQQSAIRDKANNLTMRKDMLVDIEDIDIVTGWKLSDLYQSSYETN